MKILLRHSSQPILLRFCAYLSLIVISVTGSALCQTVTPSSSAARDSSQGSISIDQVATQASQPATETIHLSIGHTLFVNTRSRVSRLYVGNPAALESYIVSPKQILLTAKGPGIVSVVLWDEKNQMQNYMISSELDLDPLRTALRGALPGERISVEEHQGHITLTGSVTSQVASDAAEKLSIQFSKDIVNSLNVNSSNAKQVQLKVRFVEVDRSRLNQYGINIFAPGPGNSIGSSTTSQFSSPVTLTSGSSGTGLSAGGNSLTVSNPLNFLFYSARAGVGISVQDLENKEIVQILSEPTITTLNGQPASFLAGGEFPFPVVQGASTGATSITIQFRPYGVKLNFTPKVNEDGTIELKVSPEVSSLDYTNEVSISGYTIPAISTKHVDTQVVLRSGQSFAISGLLDRRTTDAFARTPGIANVPILGALFKSKGVNLSTSELIVVVTPTLVDPISDGKSPSEPPLVRPFLNDKKFDTGFPTIHTP